MRPRNLAAAAAAVLAAVTAVNAGELGHYLPGVFNIRDWAVPPEKGVFYAQYNIWYRSTSLKDGNGKSINSVTVGNQQIRVDPEADIVAIAPMVIWATGLKVLGANHAIVFSPTVGNTAIAARLSVFDSEHSISRSQFGIGDLTVAPVFLGWHGAHYDMTFGYTFYAPTGSYRAGAADNVGLGFWSHQFNGSALYYPFTNKATAVMVTPVYEFNSKKSGVDVKPGAHFGVEYGISQYVHPRVEVGVAGFNLRQVTDDNGSAARNPGVHDRVNGVGPQLTVWVVPRKFSMSVRTLWDYAARDRFNGTMTNFSFAYIF